MPSDRPTQRTERHLGEQDRSKSVIAYRQDQPLRLPIPQHDHAQEHDRDVELEGARRDGLQLRRVERAGEPEKEAPSAKARSFVLTGFTPVQSAAVSSRGSPSRPAESRVAHPIHGQREIAPMIRMRKYQG